MCKAALAVLLLLTACGHPTAREEVPILDAGKLADPVVDAVYMGDGQGLDAGRPVPPPLMLDAGTPDQALGAPPIDSGATPDSGVLAGNDAGAVIPTGSLVRPGANAPAVAIAADDTWLYLSQSSGVFRMPLQAAGPAALWSSGAVTDVRELVLREDRSGAMYAAAPDTLFLLDPQGNPSTLAQGWSGISGLASTHLAPDPRAGVTAQSWVMLAVPAAGSVVTVMDPPPTPTSAPRTVTGQSSPSAVSAQMVNGEAVTYWANQGTGGVFSTDGHSTTTLTQRLACPGFLAVDSSHAYVLTETCGTGRVGQLVSVALDGSGTAILAEGVSGPTGILMVQGVLFWLQDGAVMSMTAPRSAPVQVARTLAPSRSLAANSMSLFWVEGGDVRKVSLIP